MPNVVYVFERTGGTLSVGKVKSIITKAGTNTSDPTSYNPANYTFTQDDTKKVSAEGPDSMSNNKLEKAARDLGVRGVTVFQYDPVSPAVNMVPANIDNPLGATNYGVTITMNKETITALHNSGFSLYGFKAVKATVGGGAPLVWFQSDQYGLSTSVDWAIQYEAYTSRSAIVPNGKITGLSAYPADLGQKLVVTTPQGAGDVVTGSAGNISIQNRTDQPMTCGISQVVDGAAEPMCAFPLYGNMLDAIVPIQKVMFTFSSKTVNTGTVIEKAYSSSILIDLTAETNRTVSFDINKGWEWGGFNWGQSIEPNTDVVPLLIEGP